MKSSGVTSRRCLAIFVCLLVFTVGSFGAVSSIQEPVDESVLVTLKGNVHPAAKSALDSGPADPSLPAARLMLVLKRSAAQEADFQQLLSELHDRNSQNYHRWLTPAQYAERFGASASDVKTLTAWLEAHGFTVSPPAASRTAIEFSGNVGQVQTAFHTSLRRFQVNGREHLANISDPQIPAALAGVIGGVTGLNDFFPAAELTSPIPATYDRATHLAKPAVSTTAGGNLLYLGPSDAATIYDTPNALNANYQGTQPYTGAGVTIAEVSDANINTADVDTYRSFFGLPQNTPTVVIDGNDPGVDSVTTGHTQQALLDLEVAGALAPNAKLMLYTAKDTVLVSGMLLAINRALNDNIADIVQVGFSSCEAELAASGNSFIQNAWALAAMQGVTVVVGAGDSGSAGCDAAANDATAHDGTAVNGLASTAYNIAVGGTDFDALPGNLSTYVGAKGAALKYIPELPWNNSVALGGNGLAAGNTPFLDSNGFTNLFAGGGGPSTCENGASSSATCTGNAPHGYGKPDWQATAGNLNIPHDTVRDVPDVAMMAGSGEYGATWAVCGNDYDASGNPVADCATNSGNSANIQGIGGTSAAASAFAGILALVSQSQSNRLGQANYPLYNLANQSSLYNSVFHDIKSGNNAVVCSNGSPQCGTNGFLSGYNAAAGYDFATGLGSVDASALVASWKDASYTPTTTVLTVNGSAGPFTIKHGTSVTYEVTVSSASGIPSGRAGVISNVDPLNGTYGDDVGFAGALGANGTFVYPAPDTPGGTFNLYARYAGDLTYAASQSAPVEVTVSKEDSTLSLAAYTRDQSGIHPVTGPATYPYGTYVAVDATPQGLSKVGIATGTVNFEDGQAALTTRSNNLNNDGFAEIPTYYWPAGSHSITASYLGDNSFNPSTTSAPVHFAITQAATGMTLSATPASLLSGTSTVTGTVTPTIPNLGASPSGSITLTDTTTGTTLGSATLVAGKDPKTGASIAAFTTTVNASSLAAGANLVTATYAGDTNYTGASATTTITLLVKTASTLTMTATPAALVSGTTVITGEVAPPAATNPGAPTGAVTLTDSTSGATLGTATLVTSTDAKTGLPVGAFTLNVNASSLVSGANTLTATYAGDSNYTGSTGTTVVTWNAPTRGNSQFTVAATNVTIQMPGQTTGNVSTIAVTPVNGFTGQVNLTAAMVSSPAGALAPPTLTLSAGSVTITGPTAATITGTVATTALTYALQHPGEAPPDRSRWYVGGGAVLASLVFFGIPARRRSWRTMLGLLLFLGVGMSVGCGVHLNQIMTENTTAGTYIFAVTGVDQATGQETASGTLTVTVMPMQK
ncbi:hypothetical protein ACPOL_0466 [Acidisarcina polymorpha]|uniref:Peptidase S53 domain-containing protein n=1 Tax=Acidisarcina polymorpha TaxID=2211140 RepID=A0A2Z5FSQ9_9BACT|nr:Ig-like domain repeat protein [Acidisarcina polymorpha]AXC09843.1 hypothetical protein ACPOL_0466 [Acidisarcina polymorpha]